MGSEDTQHDAATPLWHTLPVEEAVARLETDSEKGLSQAEAAARLEKYGPNRLESRGKRRPLAILAAQMKETMVLVLLAASAVSYLVGDIKDTVVILAIVVLNALLSFFQEYRAEQALEALKRLAVPEVNVVRAGHVKKVEATRLVPGDLVQLEAGVSVPADARLIESVNLKAEESALTGESVPVEKSEEAAEDPSASLGDRLCMVHQGTTITYGRGSAVVVATGMSTELGRIARLLQEVEREETPLQRRMDQLGKRLAAVALALVGVIFLLGLLRGFALSDMLLTSITLAVAAVPEGLPAVVTIALALGARRMARRKALVRRLPSVETLGSVTSICSDKTGTLTQNRMTVSLIDVAGARLDLSRAEKLPDEDRGIFELMLIGGALCSDVVDESGRVEDMLGDPTEIALVAAAEKFGFHKPDLEQSMPRVAEAPFSSERKRMLTVHQVAEAERRPLPERHPYIAFCKGGVDNIVEISTSVFDQGAVERLDDSWIARIEEANAHHASQGARVLAVAFRGLSAEPGGNPQELEKDLTFVGLVVMSDPIRPEVVKAVAQAREAGIRTIMITGDHPLTATAVARKLGIHREEVAVMTGKELEKLSEAELRDRVADTAVYARVSPEHKLRIVQALQARREIAAVTGDGVNDAPALKKADIGVAMGITGTDVAKEAADAVLLDDNYATIVAAVEEGRTIYDNIRKFVKYLLTTNLGELWTMLLGLLAGLPVPLLPLQILWINLVTDGLPARALGVEPPDLDVMKRPPHPPGEGIFARGLGRHILWVGLLMGLLTFGLQAVTVHYGFERWQTMVFTTLALAQMAHVLAIRSEWQSLFQQGLFSNPWMVMAVSSTLLLQMAVLYLEPLQVIFDTQPLTGSELAVCLLLSLLVFVAVEIEKWRKRATAGK